ncbi:gag/pol protein [Gossypium australe]|uniref:Gag/pol protein n=1 Tax=Gossypium australe TaxID=47621 RepID=A0A5B6WEW6_9ROSI|nr:gag/pol protein [Gossypium australe]
MDVKTTFLNDYIKESIYMMQLTEFIAKEMSIKFANFLYPYMDLNSWNQIFDQMIKTIRFEENVDEPCVYKRIGDEKMVFLILYVDDILLIGNDVGTLSSVKLWLTQQFSIRILRDQKNKVMALSQASYIDKLFECYGMTDSKKGTQPSISRFHLSLEDCPKASEERENMRKEVSRMLCYAMHMSRYLLCSGVGETILGESKSKTLINNEVLLLSDRLILTFKRVKIRGNQHRNRSIKQSYIPDSTVVVEYLVASEATKETIWL